VPQALALSDTSNSGITYRPISDAAPQRKIAAATHGGRVLSPLAREFIKMVKSEYPVETRD
jgi:hypothetical protein